MAIFRDPAEKFISGLYYFARWQNKKLLETTHPSNLSLAELDRLAYASLQVRMKAPVQEFTVILARHRSDFKWGVPADRPTIERATEALERDFDVVGVAERVSRFVVLAALHLQWNPESLPCTGQVNARLARSPDDKVPRRSTYRLKDFRTDQRHWIERYMLPEREVYNKALALAMSQEATVHVHFDEIVDAYERRCTEISTDGRAAMSSWRISRMSTNRKRSKGSSAHSPLDEACSCADVAMPSSACHRANSSEL